MPTHDDDELPVDLREIRLVSEDHLVGGDNDWKLRGRSTILQMRHHLRLEDLVSFRGGCAVIHDCGY